MKLVLLAFLLGIVVFQAEAFACYNGLEVWVVNGHRMSGDGLYSPDPYVVVKVGSETRRTHTLRSTRNPRWWEKFIFRRIDSDVIITEVWDKDGGIRGADDKIGTCKQTIAPDTQTYQPFVCRTNGKGYVKLFYKCR